MDEDELGKMNLEEIEEKENNCYAEFERCKEFR